ncbi:protein MEI2-like 7 [Salvia divinorum]|uniref:Protein MEI2-like 7 n=1 Tax=Salvia divinorum TaxID=28513 RepID=A0ABD1GLE2_SALDI
MCVKLPAQLNPHAEEWRPIASLPPPLPRLPHALFSYAPPLFAAPPPLQYYQVPVTFPTDIYAHNHAISDQQHRPKKGIKKLLPPRLRSAPPPPPPPPPKLEWRQKNTPVVDFSTSPAAALSSKTTLMIKNIPNQLRRDFMLKFLDGYCKTHSVAYDFLYLPFDFRKLGNLGYAFVNFTNAAAAVKMKKVLSNFKWREYYTDDGETVCSHKVCEIKWARVQGKEALIRRFEKTTFVCDDREFLPVVLDPPRDGTDRNPAEPVNVGRICRRSR